VLLCGQPVRVMCPRRDCVFTVLSLLCPLTRQQWHPRGVLKGQGVQGWTMCCAATCLLMPIMSLPGVFGGLRAMPLADELGTQAVRKLRLHANPVRVQTPTLPPVSGEGITVRLTPVYRVMGAHPTGFTTVAKICRVTAQCAEHRDRSELMLSHIHTCMYESLVWAIQDSVHGTPVFGACTWPLPESAPFLDKMAG
jgi:hypothetical protein